MTSILAVFNGDSTLNGGNKEWAEEDAALHAFNMVIFCLITAYTIYHDSGQYVHVDRCSSSVTSQIPCTLLG